MSDVANEPPLVVACLCAEWCSVCRDYRDTFDAFARTFNEGRATWIDIEDNAERMGDIDVDDFPTLLVARGEKLLFFGAIAPRAGAVETALDRLSREPSRAIEDPRLIDFASRLLPDPDALRKG